MIVASIAIGLITWFYFGRKPATVAAIASALLFLLSMVYPRSALLVYFVVATGLIGVFALGPGARKKAGARAKARTAAVKLVVDRLRKAIGI